MYEILKDKRINIYTLGCKVNQYESDAMLQELIKYGCIPVSENEAADIYIINTCSVTNMADRKSRQMIHRMRKLNNEALIVATGCYIQATGSELVENGTVDMIIGNNRKKDVARILSEHFSGEEVTDYFVDINKDPDYENLGLVLPQNHTRAYIKIQDGCNNFCTYCIIPYVRGRIRSKKLTDIINEVEYLAENGVKEIILTGINVSNYDDNSLTLADVICRLSTISGIKRIRLSSLEPNIITDDFLKRVSSLDNFCPHFHLSLQSACNKILKAMNRHYTIEDYASKCSLIRKYFENPAITTDIIVGFPGETDEDFEDTVKNLTEINLYEMHVFKYSKRKGTIAAGLPDQVDERIKTLRSNRLLELTKKQKNEYERLFSNTDQMVLMEEMVEIDNVKYFRGHTTRYILIDIPVEKMIKEDELPKDYINKEVLWHIS